MLQSKGGISCNDGIDNIVLILNDQLILIITYLLAPELPKESERERERERERADKL
jgi:hypothetical protein